MLLLIDIEVNVFVDLFWTNLNSFPVYAHEALRVNISLMINAIIKISLQAINATK